MDLKTTNNRLSELQCCVIIPTYNNHKTLKKVIEDVMNFTKDIIVVNDGSTDGTASILATFDQIKQIHIEENKGKGNALREGFELAEKLGFQYAISIDSDGQHFPKDIPVFVEALDKAETKNLLLIGARNMSQEGIPKKSSFGNKFSNFWYWFETGITLEDTQSGFRLYPIQYLKDLKFYTTKFEFEIEVIVKAAWNGTTVKNVAVNVHYDETERVSHFRPFKDFTRISILNTWFVIVTFFYIKPRDLYRKFRKKGLRRFFMEDFLGSQDAPRKKALSIALGVFIGLSPFWGFHTIIVIFLAILLKLNKAIAFTFSNVSLPPFIPFVLYASLKMGQFVLGIEYSNTMEEMTENFEVLKHLKIYIVGSFSLAITAAVVLGILGYLILSIFKRKQLVLKHE